VGVLVGSFVGCGTVGSDVGTGVVGAAVDGVRDGDTDGASDGRELGIEVDGAGVVPAALHAFKLRMSRSSIDNVCPR
jgi:hypothetical protein